MEEMGKGWEVVRERDTVCFFEVDVLQRKHIPVVVVDVTAAAEVQSQPLILSESCPGKAAAKLDFPGRKRPGRRVAIDPESLSDGNCSGHDDPFEGCVRHMFVGRATLYQKEKGLKYSQRWRVELGLARKPSNTKERIGRGWGIDIDAKACIPGAKRKSMAVDSS